MDTSDYTDLLDITDILNADPHTLLSFTDENTTLKSYTEDQQPSHSHNQNFNRTLTEPEAFQNYDAFYYSPQSASSIEPTRLNNGVPQAVNMNANADKSVLDEIAESKELDELAQYLTDHPQRNDYASDITNQDDSPDNANAPLTTNWYKNIYTHMNNHISFTTDDVPFQHSTKSSPGSPEASNIIDEQLMTEIDSLINKNVLIDDMNSPNTPNTERFFEHHTQAFAPPTLLLPDRAGKPGSARTNTGSINNNNNNNTFHNPHNSNSNSNGTGLHHNHQLVKKPSVKRLPSNVSQSPTTKRLARSPSKTELFTGMAQTAAVLATNSSSSKNLASLQRHESARAAARAVGNTFENLSSRAVARPTQTKTRSKPGSAGSVGGNGRTRLSNARSHPNLKAQAAAKSRNAHPDPPTPYTKSPSMNSIFDIDTMTQASSASSPSFLESPLRVSRLKSAKVKPSSSSIYSSATSASVRTNVSNGSCTSKSSRGSGTFDQYSQLPGSSETLETIVSMDTTASKDKDSQHQLTNYTSSNRLASSTSHPNLTYQSSLPPPPPLPLQMGSFGSTLSTKTDSSTASPTCAVYTSTPSPIAGSSNIMFTPPNLLTPNAANNYLNLTRAQSSSTEMDFAAPGASPLTPVTKTAIKFEQLSTSSPHAPKLSVWRTSPDAKRERERAQSVSLNPDRRHYINTTKFTNNFIEEPISYRSHKPHAHKPHAHSSSFSAATSLAAVAVAAAPPRLKNPSHASRNSVHSVHSSTSTNSTVSTISNPSTHDDRDPRPDTKKPATPATKHSKSSKDAAFKNLITTFNKKEPECYKPKVYSNMMQGLVEFQVKMGKSAKTAGPRAPRTRR